MGGPEKGDGSRKGPKFNIYWIYAIIAGILLFAQFMKFAPETTQTWEQEFKQKMLLQGDVEKLELIKNKDRVRVYIKPDSIFKKFYTEKLPKAIIAKDKVKGVPLFEFEVNDIKSFQERMDQTYKANPALEEVPARVTSEGDWFGPVANTVISLLLIIGVWVLLAAPIHQ